MAIFFSIIPLELPWETMMKKLSTALTMALLLGSTLNAASTLQITDGSSTPRSAANAWIAEKRSGKTPATQPYKIHEILYNAADAAEKTGNHERMLELWRTQKAFSEESRTPPTNSGYNCTIIYPLTVHETLYKAADAAQKAGDVERVLDLWRTQQAFATESRTPPSDSGYNSTKNYPFSVHEALYKAADTAKKDNNPERVLELWRTQKAFSEESRTPPSDSGHNPETIYPSSVHEAFSTTLNKETDNQRIVSLYEMWMDFEKIEKISSYSSIKRLESFKSKYDVAKKEVEKARSLVPAKSATAAPSGVSGELSVKTLVGLYGTMMLDTSTHVRFIESFQSFYKTAALRLHPDKSAEDAEKFKTLGAHKAWVEALTLAAFAASEK